MREMIRVGCRYMVLSISQNLLLYMYMTSLCGMKIVVNNIYSTYLQYIRKHYYTSHVINYKSAHFLEYSNGKAYVLYRINTHSNNYFILNVTYGSRQSCTFTRHTPLYAKVIRSTK